MHPFNDVEVPEGSAGICWFGQSSFYLKDASGSVVAVDPYFPHDRPSEKFIHPEPPIDEGELRTDAVLLTHDHSDHTCVESLARIHKAWPKAEYVGPKESIARLRESGIPDALCHVVEAGDRRTVGGFTVHAVYAKPPEGDSKAGIAPPDVTHLGYVAEAGGTSVYISGDPINNFAERDDLLGPIQALRPDIGLLTTHPTEGEFPFFEGSVKTALRLGLKAVVPAHYHCFVKRNYDPNEWAAQFPRGGPKSTIIPYKGWIVYP